MKMNGNVKRGVIVGLILSFIALLVIYNANHAEVNYSGKRQLNESTSVKKMEILSKFKQIRDPLNTSWSYFYILDRGENIWVGRELVLTDYTVDEAINYYYNYLKNNKIFYKFGLREKHNVIWFENDKYDIQGGISVKSTNPVIVQIRIGRYG